MSTRTPHPSVFHLDAFLIGALSDEEATGVKEHLQLCPTCRREVDVEKTAQGRFTEHVLGRTLPNLRRHKLFRFGWFDRPGLKFVVAPALAIAVLVFGFLPRELESNRLGIKGGPALQLFARRNGQVFHVNDGGRLAPGDEVRFAVTPAGQSYLLLVSIDGAGKANVYFPFDGKESGRIDATTRSELPGSIVLDAVAGPERVFALFSKTPLAAAPVTDALRQLGKKGAAAIRSENHLALPIEAQLSFLFVKTP